MRPAAKASGVFLWFYIITVIGGILLAPSVSGAFKYLQEGMTAPAINGDDLRNGESVSSEKLAKENIVIVVFWATWSKRSIEELGDLKTIAEKYADKPVKFIAVNVEDQTIAPATKANIEQKVAELQLPFPVIIDRNLEIFYSFGVIAVPSTAVLDTTGSLRYAPSGYSLTTHDRIVDSIEVLLGIRQPGAESVLVKGYTPEPRAARFYNLAVQMLNQRMWERALANLDMAQQADSNFSAPHNLRGHILLDNGKFEEAVSELTIATSLDSTSISAQAGLGSALYRSGDLEAAFNTLSAVLERDSTYTPAILDMALCLSDKGDSEMALRLLLDAYELDPRNPSISRYLGDVYVKAGDNSKAAESYRKALELIYPVN